MRLKSHYRLPLLILTLLCVTGMAGLRGTNSPSAVHAYPLAPGWNLVAYPNGVVSTPAYTLQSGDTGYEVAKPGTVLTPGFGYWVQTSNPSAIPLSDGRSSVTIFAQAGQPILVGDPSGVLPATVVGADVLMTYDPYNGYQYISDNTLQPGQAAYAISFSGGQLTLASQGIATATCSMTDLGSACAVGGACPQDYPVAVTNNALAHPALRAGSPPITGTIVLCFNDMSQAIAAGYETASPFRVVLNGPSSAVSSDVRVTVLRATLESWDAFQARAQAASESVNTSCVTGNPTAVVSVDYQLENLNGPVTAVLPGTLRSDFTPPETETATTLLASQHLADVVHAGSPTTGSVSAAFVATRFQDIHEVDWQLINQIVDVLAGSLAVHGPSLDFEFHFSGPQAGQITPKGGGNGPLPFYGGVDVAGTPSATTLTAAPNIALGPCGNASIVAPATITSQLSPTAVCNDGTFSYSQDPSGTCIANGGVKTFLVPPAPSPAGVPGTATGAGAVAPAGATGTGTGTTTGPGAVPPATAGAGTATPTSGEATGISTAATATTTALGGALTNPSLPSSPFIPNP